MDHRITAVHSDGVPPVPCPYAGERRGHLCIGFVPRDLGPSSRGASDRASEPLGIVMELLEPVRLRADEAARERIMRVAAHEHDGLALHFQREAARRLAKRTHTVDGPPVTHAETPHPQRSMARTDRTCVVMRVTLGVHRERGNYLAGNGSSYWARVGRVDQHLSIRQASTRAAGARWLRLRELHLLGLVEQWVEQDQLSARVRHLTQAAYAGVGWTVNRDRLQASQPEVRIESVQRRGDSLAGTLRVVVDSNIDALG